MGALDTPSDHSGRSKRTRYCFYKSHRLDNNRSARSAQLFHSRPWIPAGPGKLKDSQRGSHVQQPLNRTPSVVTNSCGAPQSCDLNGCAGTFDVKSLLPDATWEFWTRTLTEQEFINLFKGILKELDRAGRLDEMLWFTVRTTGSYPWAVPTYLHGRTQDFLLPVPVTVANLNCGCFNLS